jgi:predicted nucleotidyltransferase
MTRSKISIPTKEIAAFCHRWQVVEFSLFGSVLRDDFKPDSDLDVLVSFSPAAQTSLFDLVQMKIELEEMFHRPVDVVEKEALRNPYRNQEILANAQVVYAA